MKFNTIIETYNKFLNSKGINNVYFSNYSKWEREKGPIKTATTEIFLHKDGKQESICKNVHTTVILTGHEDELIEYTQRNALLEFIKWFSENEDKL